MIELSQINQLVGAEQLLAAGEKYDNGADS